MKNYVFHILRLKPLTGLTQKQAVYIERGVTDFHPKHKSHTDTMTQSKVVPFRVMKSQEGTEV